MKHAEAFMKLLLTCMDIDDELSTDEINKYSTLQHYSSFSGYDLTQILEEYYSDKIVMGFSKLLFYYADFIDNSDIARRGVLSHCYEAVLLDCDLDNREELSLKHLADYFGIEDHDHINIKRNELARVYSRSI